jgi:hypothetical protein
MINLSSEPSLGSMVLTKGGVLKYSYILPRGMEFPDDVEGSLAFTDRAGGEYEFSPHAGEVAEDLSRIDWLISPQILDNIPAGANFEVFVTYDETTYKVRYGRVVRKEAFYPLNPLAVEASPLMYEDDMQRSMPGPRWVAKAGRVSMHDRGEEANPRYAMASRNAIDIFGAGINLYQSSAALWYAPLQSDTIEMAVGILDGGDGVCTVVLCSNSSMTSFLGVRFTDPASGSDSVQVITGTAWNDTSTIGNSASISAIPNSGGIYKITYSQSTNQVSVFQPGATTPVLATTISTSVPHGAGYRYVGATWQGSLVTTGPKIYYWKVKDAV